MSRKTLALLSTALLVALPIAAQVDTGSADFSRYVAFGDSLTAGFASSGLALDSQRTSYPALIFNQVNGTAAGFEQPIVSDPGIPPQLFLQSLIPLSIATKAGIGSPANLTLPRPYDNMGVPGADVNDFINTVTDGGGMHDLILRGLGTQMIQGLALQPTFASVWIGNNDALGAALSGIVIDGVTLTRTADFEARFRTAISTIAGSGAQMVIGNLVNVTSIPFVTTFPPVVLNPATNQPVLIGGQTVPLIGPNGLLAPNDLVLLTAKDEMAVGKGIPVALGGSGLPLSDSVVLNATEAATIAARQAEFNAIIETVASEVGAALFDADDFFVDTAANGFSLGGVEYSTDFVTGGLFSYDGVHGSRIGYAVIANEFIRAINRKFDASIPLVNLRPFATGGPVVGFGTADLASLQMTPEFGDELLKSLGYPSVRQLEEIKRRRGGSDGGEPGDAPARPRRGRRPNRQ